jgi:hypothetical protein
MILYVAFLYRLECCALTPLTLTFIIVRTQRFHTPSAFVSTLSLGPDVKEVKNLDSTRRLIPVD